MVRGSSSLELHKSGQMRGRYRERPGHPRETAIDLFWRNLVAGPMVNVPK